MNISRDSFFVYAEPYPQSLIRSRASSRSIGCEIFRRTPRFYLFHI